MATIFNYTISTDTLNGAVAPAKLTDEIRSEETILIALQSVISIESTDTLTIEFRGDLTAENETTLDALVAAHDGNPGLNDPERFALVDGDGNFIDSTEENGVRRLAFEFQDAITGPQGPQGDQGPQGPQGDPGPVSTFGTEYTLVESLAQSTTNSTTFQTKATMSLISLPSGTYRLNWSYGWSHGANNTDFEAQILIDGSQEMLHIQEPQDSGVDQQHRESGFIANLAFNGNHTILLQWRTDDSDDTAFIRDARLELWRIS